MDSPILQSCMASFKRLLAIPIFTINDDLLESCMHCYSQLPHLINLAAYLAGRIHFLSGVTLSDYIDALPKELRDQIMEEIIIPKRGVRYLDEVAQRMGYHVGTVVRPLLKPPVQMSGRRVDARTRRVFLKRFYGGSDAVFVVLYLDGKSVQFCVQWLYMLDKKHRSRVREIRCVIAPSGVVVSDGSKDEARRKFRNLNMEDRLLLGSEDEITADLDGYESQSLIASQPMQQQTQTTFVSATNAPAQTTLGAPPQGHVAQGNFQGTGHLLGSVAMPRRNLDDSDYELENTEEEISEEEAEELYRQE